MIGVRDQAAMSVALLAIVAVAWWSPWSGASPTPSHEVDLSAVEPTTPRGLAVALLAHMDDQDVVRVSGAAASGTIDASATLEGDVSSYFVHVWTHEWPGQQPGGKCQRGAEVCRTLDDGTVVSVKLTSWGGPRGPKVTGYAYRGDSTVLVMAYGPGAGVSPVAETVAEILSDPGVGWETVHAMNRAGESLDEFEDMEIELRVSEVATSDQPGAGLRSVDQ